MTAFHGSVGQLGQTGPPGHSGPAGSTGPTGPIGWSGIPGTEVWEQTPGWHLAAWFGYRMRRWLGGHAGGWEYQTHKQRAHAHLAETFDGGGYGEH